MTVNKSSKSVSVVTKTVDQSFEDNLVKDNPTQSRTRLNKGMEKPTRVRRARVKTRRTPNTTAATDVVEQSVAAYVATTKSSPILETIVEPVVEKRGKSGSSRIQRESKPQTKRANVEVGKTKKGAPSATERKRKRGPTAAEKLQQISGTKQSTKKPSRKQTVKPSPRTSDKKTTTTQSKSTERERTTSSSIKSTKVGIEKPADIQRTATSKSTPLKTVAKTIKKTATANTKLKPRKTSKKPEPATQSARKKATKSTAKQTPATTEISVKVATTSKEAIAPPRSSKQKVASKPLEARTAKLADESNEEYIVGFQGIYYRPYQLTAKDLFMSVAQQDHFLDILTRAKEKLIAEEAGRVHQLQENDASNLPDPLDQGANEGVFHNQLRTRDRESQLVRKINRAIDCIRTGSYGYCEACGCEIPIRRLEARPIVTKCIDCKERDELRERQLGH